MEAPDRVRQPVATKKSSKSKRPYRPGRWAATTNTMAIAVGYARRLTSDEVKTLVAPLHELLLRLETEPACEGCLLGLETSLEVSRRIERLGVVRGLSHLLELISASVTRAGERGKLQPPQPMDAADLEQLRELCELQAFQLAQLSVGEFRKIFAQVASIHMPQVVSIFQTNSHGTLEQDQTSS